MKVLKIAVLMLVMVTMMIFGGLVTMVTVADEEDETVITEEVAEVAEDVEIEEDVEEPAATSVDDEEVIEEQVDNTPQGIIESQTDLVVDYIKVIDSYGSWGAYYVHSDGDLYCITIDEGVVDVCVILN